MFLFNLYKRTAYISLFSLSCKNNRHTLFLALTHLNTPAATCLLLFNLEITYAHLTSRISEEINQI